MLCVITKENRASLIPSANNKNNFAVISACANGPDFHFSVVVVVVGNRPPNLKSQRVYALEIGDQPFLLVLFQSFLSCFTDKGRKGFWECKEKRKSDSEVKRHTHLIPRQSSARDISRLLLSPSDAVNGFYERQELPPLRISTLWNCGKMASSL
ncbi:hypothetical protein CEXT_362501 [Caerostris extrusa]|uniref:Uncharacterized protein n=1 Tax=Caerostris extrusa TaxID=172846 RepID=A0AAV4RII6_CAEEX|nr:hypothetical protein CEXT_362501 [Caerostris extrusa]